MSDDRKIIVKKAILYRIITDKHLCPYGIKAKNILKKKGYDITDNHLKTREEIDKFKEEYSVKTTPQIFIDGKRIGGYNDLLIFFKKDNPKKEKSYVAVISVFATAFLLATAIIYGYSLGFINIVKLFMGFSISTLAMLKLQNIESFSNQFITYDLLAIKWLSYAYIYPFAEMIVGIGIISGIFISIIAMIAIFIGCIGVVSVYYAVYVQKRELKCACVGGESKVPLGFLSLTENIMMIVMGICMLLI